MRSYDFNNSTNGAPELTVAYSTGQQNPPPPGDLQVIDLGKSYTRKSAITPNYLYFSSSQSSGSTSVRNVDLANLEWKKIGYYQRNREIGQVFNIPANTTVTLDAIVLRTGNSSSAVKAGAAGAKVHLQIFEVIGNPVINDNGTPQGTNATHGFTTNHRADDYLEGVTYHSLAIAQGGIFLLYRQLPPMVDRTGIYVISSGICSVIRN